MSSEFCSRILLGLSGRLRLAAVISLQSGSAAFRRPLSVIGGVRATFDGLGSIRYASPSASRQDVAPNHPRMVGTGLPTLTPGTIPEIRLRSAEATCLRTAPRASWPDTSPQWRNGTVHAAELHTHLGVMGLPRTALTRRPAPASQRAAALHTYYLPSSHAAWHAVASSWAARLCRSRAPRHPWCQGAGSPFSPIHGAKGYGHAAPTSPHCGWRGFGRYALRRPGSRAMGRVHRAGDAGGFPGGRFPFHASHSPLVRAYFWGSTLV